MGLRGDQSYKTFDQLNYFIWQMAEGGVQGFTHYLFPLWLQWTYLEILCY